MWISVKLTPLVDVNWGTTDGPAYWLHLWWYMTFCLRQVREALRWTGTFYNCASFMSACRWCGPLLQNGAGTSRDPPRREPSGHDLPGGGQLASGVQMDAQQHRYHSLFPRVQVSASFHLKAFWRWSLAQNCLKVTMRENSRGSWLIWKTKSLILIPPAAFLLYNLHIYSLSVAGILNLFKTWPLTLRTILLSCCCRLWIRLRNLSHCLNNV